jgi:hypothetical protein
MKTRKKPNPEKTEPNPMKTEKAESFERRTNPMKNLNLIRPLRKISGTMRLKFYP